MSPEPRASILTIPCELRNAIYLNIFAPDSPTPQEHLIEPPDTIARALKLYDYEVETLRNPGQLPNHHLALLQTCKQIHHEAYPLALSLTTFHVSGESCYPDCFSARVAHMREDKIKSIRHVTLTARIANLRALNETWHGLPFNNPRLSLDSLTIIPTKPDASRSCYAEVADLSQTHTLAYVLAETFKRLRNVGVVHVRNSGTFNAVVWRLVYRSLVWRVFQWGGDRCGLRFWSSGEEEGREWFTVWLGEGQEEGNDVGDEVIRMLGDAS